MKRIILICLLLIMGLSARHNYAQQSPDYSETDDTIEVNVGQDFVITFEFNQFTGFKWQLVESLDKDLLELVNVEYIPGPARFRGAGGKEIWAFKALSEGETTISLEYIRPGERNVQPAKKKVFAVTVKEPTPTNR